jgi:hypothetical protein
LKIFGRILAVAAVLNDLEADFLAFDEGAQSGAFNGRDMDEYVRAAVLRGDEAVAFGSVEKLDGSSVHDDFLSSVIDVASLCTSTAAQIDFERGRSPMAVTPETKFNEQDRCP